MTSAANPTVGALLRDWRRHRRLSQQELAGEARVSTRHLSFIETGRARPSAEMVMRLAETLQVPLRERNTLLLSAGYAPAYPQRPLDAPEMGPVRATLDELLRLHEPFPAVVIDAHWGLVAANRGVAVVIDGVAPHLLAEPVNLLRLNLHPDGLAPRVVNVAEWRGQLLDRLWREAVLADDPALFVLHEELRGYPAPADEPVAASARSGIAVPLRIRLGDAELAFLGTKTTFGAPADITVAELAIELFFPLDTPTAETMRRLVP